MNEKWLQRISRNIQFPDWVAALSERISPSDLNSLLLAVFSKKTAQISPSELLQHYAHNRFVHPAAVDAIGFAEFSLQWLKAAQALRFEPLQLSPLCPLGTCSVVATAHQNKVVSALRGTEVVADATNVLALESTLRRKEAGFPSETMRFSTVHRHVRAQEIPNIPGFSAHFSILGLTSAGRDAGSFQFEKTALWEHLRFYQSCLGEVCGIRGVKFRLKNLQESDDDRLFQSVFAFLTEKQPDWILETQTADQSQQAYYRGLQFKVTIPGPEGRALEIADGGFTQWTQHLSGRKKERFLISGIGLEWLYKLQKNTI